MVEDAAPSSTPGGQEVDQANGSATASTANETPHPDVINADDSDQEPIDDGVSTQADSATHDSTVAEIPPGKKNELFRDTEEVLEPYLDDSQSESSNSMEEDTPHGVGPMEDMGTRDGTSNGGASILGMHNVEHSDGLEMRMQLVEHGWDGLQLDLDNVNQKSFRIHITEVIARSDPRAKSEEMNSAIFSEINGILAAGVMDLCSGVIPQDAVELGTKMVLAVKNNQKKKARLVVLGHQDPEKEFLVHQSAKIHRYSIRTVLFIAALHK